MKTQKEYYRERIAKREKEIRNIIGENLSIAEFSKLKGLSTSQVMKRKEELTIKYFPGTYGRVVMDEKAESFTGKYKKFNEEAGK